MMKTPMTTSLMERREKKIKEANEQICMLGNIVKRLSFVGKSRQQKILAKPKNWIGTNGNHVYGYSLLNGRFLAVKRIVDSQHETPEEDSAMAFEFESCGWGSKRPGKAPPWPQRSSGAFQHKLQV
uniref:Uncharacterized protein n=1 Tax=Populus alba TaxID=43335 RepID=A0A4U5QG21_POPAL|nr:hypothetical protein D5086_0000113480 [Populus alba]